MHTPAAVNKCVFYYVADNPVPLAPLARAAKGFLMQTGSAETALTHCRDRAELNCGPVNVVLDRVTGDLTAAQAVFWGAKAAKDADARDDMRTAVQVTVTCRPDESGVDPETLAGPVLAGIAFSMASLYEPDALQWLKPGAWTTGAEFLGVVQPAMSERLSLASEMEPGPDETTPEDEALIIEDRIRPARPERPGTRRRPRPEQHPGLSDRRLSLSERAVVVESEKPCMSAEEVQARITDLRLLFREGPAECNDPEATQRLARFCEPLAASLPDLAVARVSAEPKTAGVLALASALFVGHAGFVADFAVLLSG